MAWFSRVFVVLGLSKSKNVDPFLLTSYPFTYALPDEIWYKPKSSDASPPSSVIWPSAYTPLLPIPLFEDYLIFIENGFVM